MLELHCFTKTYQPGMQHQMVQLEVQLTSLSFPFFTCFPLQVVLGHLLAQDLVQWLGTSGLQPTPSFETDACLTCMVGEESSKFSVLLRNCVAARYVCDCNRHLYLAAWPTFPLCPFPCGTYNWSQSFLYFFLVMSEDCQPCYCETCRKQSEYVAGTQRFAPRRVQDAVIMRTGKQLCLMPARSLIMSDIPTSGHIGLERCLLNISYAGTSPVWVELCC